MKIEIRRVWDGNLNKYKSILDKFDVEYQSDIIAYITFENIEQIFKLVKELKQDLYVDHFNINIIYIYDDYIE